MALAALMLSASSSSDVRGNGEPGEYKKLSYRRETARQLPTSRGGRLDPQASSVPSVKRTLR